MAETEFPLSPLEIQIDRGTDFQPAEVQKPKGVLRSLAPLALGLLGPIGLIAGGVGAAANIGGRQRDIVSEAFTEAANRGQVGAQEALSNPQVLMSAGTRLLSSPNTAAQGQAMIDQAQNLINNQNTETQRRFQGESVLNKRLQTNFQFGRLNDIAENYRTALALFEEGSPTANTQLARILEKMIDPTGVVRPGDFTNIVGASPIAEQFEQMFRAGKVPQALVPDLMRAIALVAKAKQTQFRGSILPKFRELAIVNNLNPDNVVFDPMEDLGLDQMLATLQGSTAGPQQAAPAPLEDINRIVQDPLARPFTGNPRGR